MAEAAAAPGVEIVYLEPDDEIPSVIRRVHEPGAARVILVAPGRIKALSSVIALRLLARIAGAAGMEVSLVADAPTRAMAAEAGIAAFPSLADAQAGGPATERPALPRASIRVVRGERAPRARAASPVPDAPASAAAAREPPAISRGPVTRGSAGDETRPIPIARPAAPSQTKRPRPRPAGRAVPLLSWRTLQGSTLLAIAAAVALVGAVAAAVIPAATIHLTPRTQAGGPFDYRLTAAAYRDAGQLAINVTGTATGKHVDSTPAKGTASFFNWTYVTVEVPKGTRVSAEKQNFTTDTTIIVPPGPLPLQPGTQVTAVTAVAPGPDGNVAAGAIDTIEDRKIASRLRGFPAFAGRLVENAHALVGGTSTTSPEVTQKDVDAAADDLQAEAARRLAGQIAAHADRVYVQPAKLEEATITIPEGLVGTRGDETFELSGTLAYERAYALGTDLQKAANAAMRADAKAVPSGRTLIDGSVTVTPTGATSADGRVVAQCRVTGQTAATIDVQALKSEIAGLTAEEAHDRLASLGTPRIDFWPAWVTAVPRLGFRVDIVIDAPHGSESASPAATAAP